MKIEKKVTNKVCAELLGVGRPTVVAVRQMLGIVGARKLYPSAIYGFLRKYQDFQLADAQNLAAFKARHPAFALPAPKESPRRVS